MSHPFKLDRKAIADAISLPGNNKIDSCVASHSVPKLSRG